MKLKEQKQVTEEERERRSIGYNHITLCLFKTPEKQRFEDLSLFSKLANETCVKLKYYI